LLFWIYKTVAVAAPVVPSPFAPEKSAKTWMSEEPTSVASVSKVPLVVAKAFTFCASIKAFASPDVPIETVAAPPSRQNLH